MRFVIYFSALKLEVETFKSTFVAFMRLKIKNHAKFRNM